MGAAVGHNQATINGTLTLAVDSLIITRSGSISDERFGFSDLYPQFALRWNSGVHNFMIYGMGDIPVGTYIRTPIRPTSASGTERWMQGWGTLTLIPTREMNSPWSAA